MKVHCKPWLEGGILLGWVLAGFLLPALMGLYFTLELTGFGPLVAIVGMINVLLVLAMPAQLVFAVQRYLAVRSATSLLLLLASVLYGVLVSWLMYILWPALMGI